MQTIGKKYPATADEKEEKYAVNMQTIDTASFACELHARLSPAFEEYPAACEKAMNSFKTRVLCKKKVYPKLCRASNLHTLQDQQM